MLEKLEEKRKRLDSMRPLTKEILKNLEEWFEVELTYTSNVIEGNTPKVAPRCLGFRV